MVSNIDRMLDQLVKYYNHDMLLNNELESFLIDGPYHMRGYPLVQMIALPYSAAYGHMKENLTILPMNRSNR